MPLIAASDCWVLLAIAIALLWARSLVRQNRELHLELRAEHEADARRADQA